MQKLRINSKTYIVTIIYHHKIENFRFEIKLKFYNCSTPTKLFSMCIKILFKRREIAVDDDFMLNETFILFIFIIFCFIRNQKWL